MAQPSCKKRVINPIWEGKTAPGLGSPRCTYQKWWLSMENGWIPWGAMVVIHIFHSLPTRQPLTTPAPSVYSGDRASPSQSWVFQRIGGGLFWGFHEQKRGFNMLSHLVGGFNPSEKYWSTGRIIPYIMEKTCSKPPTRHVVSSVLHWFLSPVTLIQQVLSFKWHTCGVSPQHFNSGNQPPGSHQGSGFASRTPQNLFPTDSPSSGFPIKEISQMTFSKSRTARGSAMVTDWNNTIQIQLGDHNQHAGHAPEVHTSGSPRLRRHNIAKQIANAKIGTGSCRGTKSAPAESNPEMNCMRMDFDPFCHLKYGAHAGSTA